MKWFWIQKTLSLHRETNGKPPIVVMEAGFTRGAEKQLLKRFQKHKEQNQRAMLQEMSEVQQTK